MSVALPPFTVSPQEAGHTLAKVLRSRLGGPSWTEVRKLIAARRVKVGDADLLGRRPTAQGKRGRRSARTSQAAAACRASRTARRPPSRRTRRRGREAGRREHGAPPGRTRMVRGTPPTRPDARRPDAVGHRPPARTARAATCRGCGSSTGSTRRRAGWSSSPDRRWPSANSACSSASTRSCAVTSRSCPASSRRGRSARNSCRIAATAAAAARTLPDVGKEAITHVAVEERLPATRCFRAGWRPAARTRSAFTSPRPATRCAATRSMSRSRTARCSTIAAAPRGWLCTPPNSASHTRRPAASCTGRCRCRGDLAKFVERLRGGS